MNGAPVELIEQRTANSKTFLMPDGRIGLDVSIGAIHYKDNYQDQTEPWKDIDCAIQPDGTIRKAPYDLDIDLNAIGFRCRVKEDGSEFALQLTDIPVGLFKKVTPQIVGNQVIWENAAPDMDIVLVAERTRVSLKRILKSEHSPTKAKFALTRPLKSIAVLRSRAWDADREEIPVGVTEVAGKLTEKIDATGRKFPIEIDPSLDLQVSASADDCSVYWSGSAWVMQALTYTHQFAGYVAASDLKEGGGMRFLNVTIPQGTTIDTAYLILRCHYAKSNTTVNTRITGEDVDDAATFSNLADYQARRGTVVGGANDDNITTAQVDWDAIPAWSANTDYNSPEIKTIIQEIVDRGGWASGNDMVIFWDDHDDRSTHATDTRRLASAYDDSPTYAPQLHIEYIPAITEKTSSDAGSGADAYVSLEKGVAKSSSDAGSGAEGTPVPSATLAGSETGSGIEAFVARLLAAFDAGTGAEVGGLLKDLLVSELGRGSDSLIAKIETPTKGGGMKLWT